jgi:hypothetical protein
MFQHCLTGRLVELAGDNIGVDDLGTGGGHDRLRSAYGSRRAVRAHLHWRAMNIGELR